LKNQIRKIKYLKLVKNVDELKWAAVKNAGHKLVIWFKDDLSREEDLISSVSS